ncbi:hypothetical protein GG681_00435 [Epibacterium sp. SM1969]|uniref:Lipoprotein n=1 Tax=Tritonibacter aquimaris TaxID=2663379 RepID=A0A844AP40_9RHOB|nr:hypothetical protein [Tritonibacter aquimaris]MQY41097.1 hypothetical protein [Tritonibacter aquimaris]
MVQKRKLSVATAAICATLVVAGCGAKAKDDRTRYDGIPFRASAKALNKKENLAEFRVAVKDALRSENGARAAAHHEGTAYCIANYGLSDINWRNDPLNLDSALVLDGKDAIFEGVCDA